MSKIIFILIFIISTAYAQERRHNEGLYKEYAPKAITKKDSIELMYSVYTYHLTNPENIGNKYENKVSKDGRLIDNPMFGIGFKTVVDTAYQTNNFFGGQDSVGSPIFGIMRATGYRSSWGFHAGFVYGAYFMNNKTWVERGIMHTNALKVSDASSIVPLIGVEISQEIPLGKTIYLKLNNLITPVLTNHSVSFGINY